MMDSNERDRGRARWARGWQRIGSMHIIERFSSNGILMTQVWLMEMNRGTDLTRLIPLPRSRPIARGNEGLLMPSLSRDPDIDMLCRNIQMEQNMDRIWARIHSFARPFFLRLDAQRGLNKKRLRLAVHCLGSAPTGLTSGVLSLVRCRFVTIGSWERGITSGGWLALRCSIPAVPQQNYGE